MKNHSDKKITRRKFIENSSKMSATVLLAGRSFVYSGGSERIKVGLIGCGGRGTGAGIIDCAESSDGVELVAMGDLFQDHIDQVEGGDAVGLGCEIDDDAVLQHGLCGALVGL